MTVLDFVVAGHVVSPNRPLQRRFDPSRSIGWVSLWWLITCVLLHVTGWCDQCTQWSSNAMTFSSQVELTLQRIPPTMLNQRIGTSEENQITQMMATGRSHGNDMMQSCLTWKQWHSRETDASLVMKCLREQAMMLMTFILHLHCEQNTSNVEWWFDATANGFKCSCSFLTFLFFVCRFSSFCGLPCWKMCAPTTMASLKFPLQDPLQQVASINTTMILVNWTVSPNKQVSLIINQHLQEIIPSECCWVIKTRCDMSRLELGSSPLTKKSVDRIDNKNKHRLDRRVRSVDWIDDQKIGSVPKCLKKRLAACRWKRRLDWREEPNVLTNKKKSRSDRHARHRLDQRINEESVAWTTRMRTRRVSIGSTQKLNKEDRWLDRRAGWSLELPVNKS